MQKIILDHHRRIRHHYKRIVLVAAGIIAFFAMSWTGWQLVDNWRISRSPARQAEQTVERVGGLMVLPKDEQPAVVTVVDASKIKNIPFLQRSAKNNDQVLIYSKAKKAILYRPADKKIVDVGPVSIAQLPENKN